MEDYAAFVRGLTKPGEAIAEALTPNRAHIWHAATGVSTEAGELLDAVKKHVVYNRPLDHQNVIEELGDLEFYLESLRHGLGISREEVLAHNVAKLSVRYERGYSDAAAQARADKLPPAD